jgi:hypothetical protein
MFHSYDFIKNIWMRFLIQISIRVLKKKFVEKLMSFERQQELCWKLLYQNSFYMFIKTLDELKKICPQSNVKCIFKNTLFYSK